MTASAQLQGTERPTAIAPTRPRSVLLVDADCVFRERLARVLRARGFDVMVAADGPSGVAAARHAAPDFALVDASPRGAIEDDVLSALVSGAPAVRIVVLTGNGSIAAAVGALRRGASDYLTKPIDADAVVAALDHLGSGGPPQARAAPDVTPSLARATWEHLQRILVGTNGNVSETARRLGIPRRSLQGKLRKAPPRR